MVSPWHAFVSISLTKVHCHQPAFWAYSQVSAFLGLSCPSEVSAGNMESLAGIPSAWLQTHLLIDIFPDKSSPPSSAHMDSFIHPSIHSFKRCVPTRCLPSHCYGLEGGKITSFQRVPNLIEEQEPQMMRTTSLTLGTYPPAPDHTLWHFQFPFLGLIIASNQWDLVARLQN